jgi:ABC-type spermidine/putrescine transport system permease subunit II
MPLMVVAGVGAGVIVRWIGRERVGVADDGDAPERRVSGGIRGLAIGVWVMSVIAPGVLFAWHIRHWAPVEANSLVNFWRQNTGAVAFSSEIAGVVAGLVGVIAMAVYVLRSASGAGARRVAGVSLWMLLATGLVPGVLVGSATLAFWNAPFVAREAGDSMWPTVLAHTARFGFLGPLAGWWLASLETSDERGARLMLGGESLRAWVVLCLRPRWGVVAGVALAAGALSLHEIESTVIVQPPGPTSLAQYVLDKLHYNRNEELCAASVNLFAVGIVLAVGAGVLIGMGRSWPRH